MLRTFQTSSSDGRVVEWPYTQFYTTSYEPDPAHPDFLRLKPEENDNLQLGRVELTAAGSPAGLVELRGDANFEADTFDWYVVEKSLRPGVPSRSAGASTPGAPGGGLAAMVGGSGPRRPAWTPEYAAPVGDVNDPSLAWVSWQIDPTPDDAEARYAKTESVHLSWELGWYGDRLEIQLDSEPLRRNYRVFVVVEETLDSGSIIHTSLPVFVNTALTMVPQSFFDEEAAAYARAREGLRDIASKYRGIGRVKPGQQKEGSVRPGDLVTNERMRQAFERIQQREPALAEAAVKQIAGIR